MHFFCIVFQKYLEYTKKNTKKEMISEETTSCAQDETRTHTTLLSLPPQSSVYTNFTTCASSQLACDDFVAYATRIVAAVAPLHLRKKLSRWFNTLKIVIVPRTGLEPAHLAAYAPETYASTNSATWAFAALAANSSLLERINAGRCPALRER